MKTYIINLIFLVCILVTSNVHAALNGNEILQLHSGTTAEMNAMSNPQAGHIIHNTTTNTLWHYDGTNWIQTDAPINIVSTDADNQIKIGADSGAYLGPTVYTGFFIINSNGSQAITGIPFQPSQITFVAHANIEAVNVDAGSSNSDTRVNLFWGSMNGFARINNGNTTQQVIFIGQSARETGSPYINNISKYASNSNCIGIRYANENGSKIGLLTASLTSFNSDGFTINISRNNDATSENLVVLYTAYK